MSKKLVQDWYNKISDAEKDIPLLIVAGIAYTPRQTMDEVNRDTSLGRQLQTLVENKSFGTTLGDENTLIKTRLQLKLQGKPDKPMFVVLPSSGLQPRTLTPSQLLNEINNNTKLGQQWISNEAEYMRKLLAVR